MLKQVVLILFLCWPALLSAQRPNILIIMTDQQTVDGMSNAGNKDLHTPAMDCTSSRIAIFSGKMPLETGFIGNSPEKDGQWPDSLLMMGKIFQNEGYQTGYVGKWHLPVSSTKISQHGFGFTQNTNFLDYNDAGTPAYCATFIKDHKDKLFLLVASFLNPLL